MNDHPWIKVALAWLGTGLSVMTPLQWLQAIACVLTIVYTGIQIYKSLRKN